LPLCAAGIVDASGSIGYYGCGMKRNTLLIVIVVVAGIFLLFNPLQFFRKGGVSRPSVSSTTVSSLVQFAQANWRSPDDYVLSAFADHDVVFLGEFYKLKENVQLVSRLIPRLYAAGIRTLGIEYALSDDQAQIDALLTAPSWDEATARAITFDWLVTWGYKEYLDLYQAAWQVNHGLPAGAKPFKILGLNVRQHWELLKSDKDVSDPATVARIMQEGIPDAHIAQVIETGAVKTGEKILVYCGTQHIFTRYHNKDYEKNATDMKLSESRRAGNIIYDAIGARAFCISLHAPWPDRTQKSGLAFPADRAIDALIDALPADKKSGGWNTAGTPLGALSIRDSSYANGDAGMTLADLFDGYIVQGPLAQYTVVTPIKDFVRPEDAAKAAQEFPGVKPTPPSVAQVNQAIADDVQSIEKMLAQFK
jgi:hypothetical protein